MTEVLYQVTARHFCAGVVLENTAPILRYMRGWSLSKVLDYCQRKGWRCR